MLAGELSYRSGDIDAGFGALRAAVSLEDRLVYDEPWAWMQPVRHALGALLLEQAGETRSTAPATAAAHLLEAERLYRADLYYDATRARALVHPRNPWAKLMQ